MWESVKAWVREHPNLTSFLTFLLFFAFLANILIWPVALIVSVSLAIHEYSHVLVMKRYGMGVKAVLFIPLLGAVAIGGGGRMISRKEESLMALAGPIAGYLSAVPVYVLFKLTGILFFKQSVIIIVLINFFNLLPISPLDGGRAVKSFFMSMKNKTLGFILWGFFTAAGFWCLTLFGATFILILVAIFAWKELYMEWKVYSMQKKIMDWLSSAYEKNPQIISALRDSVRNNPDVSLFYSKLPIGKILRDVCKNDSDVILAINLLQHGLYPRCFEPMSVRDRVVVMFLYLALVFTPILFFVGLPIK